MSKKEWISALIFSLFFSAFAQNHTEGEIRAFQDSINAELADPEATPILEEDFEGFNGIEFFPINLDYQVTAFLTETEEHEVFRLTYSDDPSVPVYVKYGYIEFEIDGNLYRLNVYQNQEWISGGKESNQLFLPFKDWTNGPLSYGGGRFLDLEVPEVGNQIELDFNLSYNPPCAYNYYLACPLIPEANFIETEIPVGIMAFETF